MYWEAGKLQINENEIYRYLGYRGHEADEVTRHFPEGTGEVEEDERPRIEIVGKPNVGKSSIVNKLLGKNRVIVSDVAGTTRDAIDTAIKYNGKEYVFIVPVLL